MSMRFDDYSSDFDPDAQPDQERLNELHDEAKISDAARRACEVNQPESATDSLKFDAELMKHKHFTLDEANRSLVYLEPIVGDITRTYRRIVHLRRRMDQARDGATETRLEREYDRCMDRLGDFVDELHDVGVELRDFELGLLDFPAQVARREIYYTWQPGDVAVEHWHDYDDVTCDRQPLAMLKAG